MKDKSKSVVIHLKTGDLAIVDWSKGDFDCSVEQKDKGIVINITKAMLEVGPGKRKWSFLWSYVGTYSYEKN